MTEVVPTWQTIDLPILRAIVAAEQNGRNVNEAARGAVPSLEHGRFKKHIRLLKQDGYLTAEVCLNASNGIVASDRVLSASPKAYSVTGAWPNAETVLRDLLLALQAAEQAEPNAESAARSPRPSGPSDHSRARRRPTSRRRSYPNTWDSDAEYREDLGDSQRCVRSQTSSVSNH